MSTPDLVVSLPDLERDALESFVRGKILSFNPAADVSASKIDNLVLNTLRHDHSNYDQAQTTERLLEIHTVIVEAYPHLSEVAARQNADRLRRDAVFGVSPFTHSDRSPAEIAEYRRKREDASLEAVAAGRFAVGEQASFRRNGRTFIGVIAWVGKSKIGIELVAPDGVTFIESLHASTCTIVNIQGPAPKTCEDRATAAISVQTLDQLRRVYGDDKLLAALSNVTFKFGLGPNDEVTLTPVIDSDQKD